MRFIERALITTAAALVLSAGTLAGAGSADWFDFAPESESTNNTGSALDLRGLNEPVAGANGFVSVRDGHFVLGGSMTPVRFWAVNGPSGNASSVDDFRREARLLASYGVNLVRVHGGLYDEQGEFDPEQVQRRIAIVEAMKAEGIYVHFSIYFPLWLKPRAGHPWLTGYNGAQHPFAALMFNPAFQEHYQSWWRALLLTPSRTTGKRLVDEPAVFGAEIQNEDSYFFWTFSRENLPEPQRALLEQKFAEWLKSKYGTLAAAVKAWDGPTLPGDDLANGRLTFRPLAAMFTDRSHRDGDTATFLLENQRAFYAAQTAFLRGLGFKGLITCSNWATANPEIFGPLEKYSYTVGDFIDRHGYHSVRAKGEGAEWSIRDGHTYRDRSAYRFDPEDNSPRPLYVHPAMDPKYAGLPSMISETTWNRPNRFRSEAPLYFAAYGALQDSDAIVHFAFDGATWSVKPNYWMQPWTLMSPAMMGQFPAAAVLYRQSLVKAADIVATVTLGVKNLEALEGTPLGQDAALDELRLKDVGEPAAQAGRRPLLDPLIHYVGQTRVTFRPEDTTAEVADVARFLDRTAQRVVSTTGELALNYGQGYLKINAPAAQGISGLIGLAGNVELADVRIASSMELGHIVLVSLDQRPLRSSRRVLLQVMSEEQPSGFQTAPAADGTKIIRSIGTDPWQVRTLAGTVTFKSSMAGCRVTALDLNGRPAEPVALDGATLHLKPRTLYYLIEPPMNGSTRDAASSLPASTSPARETHSP